MRLDLGLGTLCSCELFAVHGVDVCAARCNAATTAHHEHDPQNHDDCTGGHQNVADHIEVDPVDGHLKRVDEDGADGEQEDAQADTHLAHLFTGDGPDEPGDDSQDEQNDAYPEKKRKIIGRTFIDVFDAESTKLDNIKYLAQGTIYPDVIESAGAKSGKAHVIKSHHNVGGLPEEMNLKLVEPLRELFKDEVRRLGLELGLPYDMVYRHPFPGPGLGVRILGEVKKEYADLLRRADHIFIEELRKADWYHKVSQAFVVFQPVKSVGVVGDGRRYAWVVALRAVETIDFMTARWAHLPYELLETVSGRIINEIEGISRVTYDVSSKPPATIEWE